MAVALGLIKKAQIESTTIYVAFVAIYCKAEKKPACIYLNQKTSLCLFLFLLFFYVLLFWGFSFIKQNSSRIHESNMTFVTLPNKTFNVAN